MHVPIGNADQGGRNARTSQLDRVGVRSRAAWGGLGLMRDALRLGGLEEKLLELGVDVRAPGNDGTRAHLEVAGRPLVEVGIVGRVGDVHGDSDLGIDTVGRRFRAAKTDFLLDRADREQGTLDLLGGAQAERFHDDPDPALVVEPRAGDEVVAEVHHIEAKRNRIADGNDLLDLLFVLCADIDPQLAQLDLGAAFVGLHQMHRFATDDTVHRAVPCVYDHARPGNDRRVETADLRKEDEALVIDVADHHADLVAVSGEHHARRALRIESDDDVTVHVRLDRIREGLHSLADDFLHRLLEAGRRRRLLQSLEKVVWFFTHCPFLRVHVLGLSIVGEGSVGESPPGKCGTG